MLLQEENNVEEARVVEDAMEQVSTVLDEHRSIQRLEAYRVDRVRFRG